MDLQTKSTSIFSNLIKNLTEFWVGLSYRLTQDSEYRILQDGSRLLISRGANQKSLTSFTNQNKN